MDHQNGNGALPARSRPRDKASVVAGLLGLATAIALGALLYMGRNYTQQTEPSWWWNALILCGLATGVFGLASIILGSGFGGRAAAAPSPPTHFAPPEPPPPEPWEDVATQAVPVATARSSNGVRATAEVPTPPTGWTAVYRRRRRGWSTEVEEVSGCSVQAPTLYEARDGILEALAAWLGGPVDDRDVADEVELPPEVARAVSAATSARGSPDEHDELARAASVLVDQFELDRRDAAALLSVPYDELDEILDSNGAAEEWHPEPGDGDEPLGAWQEHSSAP